MSVSGCGRDVLCLLRSQRCSMLFLFAVSLMFSVVNKDSEFCPKDSELSFILSNAVDIHCH